jgi:hypothetical protein
MLVQVDEDLWIDPMEVVEVFPYVGPRPDLHTSLVVRRMRVGDEAIYSRWFLAEVVQQLNGKMK